MPTEEEIKAVQEKMNNMSPEELKEFQKQQCIFCQIISGKVNSKKIYEDDTCIGILDINPANPGHVLLMPKEHYPLMPLIPPEIIGHLFMVAKALSRVMLTAVGAEGSDVFVANGSAAGQRAQHFMLHVIPRKPGDKVKMDIPINELDKKEVEKAKDMIIEKVTLIFKQKPSETKVKIETKEPIKDSSKKETETPKKEVKKSSKEKTPKKQGGVSLDDIAKLIN